jgi:hypothetical protein
MSKDALRAVIDVTDKVFAAVQKASRRRDFSKPNLVSP